MDFVAVPPLQAFAIYALGVLLGIGTGCLIRDEQAYRRERRLREWDYERSMRELQ